MDKDILRMVLIGAGILLIFGLYLWDRVKRKNRKEDEFEFGSGDFRDDIEMFSVTPNDDDDPLFSSPDKIVTSTRSTTTISRHPDDEFGDTAPAYSDKISIRRRTVPTEKPVENEEPIIPKGLAQEKWTPPELLQLAVVANSSIPFEGPILARVFEDLKLTYGDMGIFHYHDSDTREIWFSVASMVEPGTFPEGQMEGFTVPGLMLFMQPRLLNDPLTVLDQFISTSRELAERLDGILWDGKRQPLTEETIEELEKKLTPPLY